MATEKDSDFQKAQDSLRRIEDYVGELEQSQRDLRAALERWGQHDPECRWWANGVDKTEGPCNCGFKKAVHQ